MSLYDEYVDPNIGSLLEQLCPDGVEIVRMRDVVLKGSKFDWTENDFAEYVDLSSVDPATCKIGQTTTVTSENHPSRAQQKIEAGDVLFGTTRPLFMRTAIVPQELDGHVASTGYCALRANLDRVLPTYMFYVLRTQAAYKFIENYQSEGGYPAISDKLLKRFEFPLPPLEVQQQIVDILDTFSDLGASLRREKELRQEQFEHYRDALLDFDAVGQGYVSPALEQQLEQLCPDGVEMVRLGEVTTLGKRNEAPKNMRGDSVHLYSLPAFDTGNGPEMVAPTSIKSSKRVIEGKVVLAPKLNPHKPRVWLVNEPSSDAYASSEYHLFYPREKVINLSFLHFEITTELPTLLSLVNKGSNSHQRLSAEHYQNLEIPLPPLEVQQQIVGELDMFADYINGLDREIELRQQQFEFYRERLLSLPVKD